MKLLTNLKARIAGTTPEDNSMGTEVAIECVGHRWVISFRNPGQKNWLALRSPVKHVTVRNHMDEEIKRIPAVHVFDSRAQAKQHVTATIPQHVEVVRTASEISEFLEGIRGPAQ